MGGVRKHKKATATKAAAFMDRKELLCDFTAQKVSAVCCSCRSPDCNVQALARQRGNLAFSLSPAGRPTRVQFLSEFIRPRGVQWPAFAVRCGKAAAQSRRSVFTVTDQKHFSRSKFGIRTRFPCSAIVSSVSGQSF